MRRAACRRAPPLQLTGCACRTGHFLTNRGRHLLAMARVDEYEYCLLQQITPEKRASSNQRPAMPCRTAQVQTSGRRLRVRNSTWRCGGRNVDKRANSARCARRTLLSASLLKSMFISLRPRSFAGRERPLGRRVLSAARPSLRHEQRRRRCRCAVPASGADTRHGLLLPSGCTFLP